MRLVLAAVLVAGGIAPVSAQPDQTYDKYFACQAIATHLGHPLEERVGSSSFNEGVGVSFMEEGGTGMTLTCEFDAAQATPTLTRIEWLHIGRKPTPVDLTEANGILAEVYKDGAPEFNGAPTTKRRAVNGSDAAPGEAAPQ
jgi:hypothetical protein